MPDERRDLPATVSVVLASELDRRFPDMPVDDDHLEPDAPRQVHRISRRLQSLRPRRYTGNVNILQAFHYFIPTVTGAHKVSPGSSQAVAETSVFQKLECPARELFRT